MQPFSGKQSIPRQWLESQIQLATSRVELQKALLHAHQQRDIEERKFYYDLWCAVRIASGYASQGSTIAEPPYLRALKQFYKAHEDLLRVQLSELEAQLAIHEKMLEEGERAIMPATSFPQ